MNVLVTVKLHTFSTLILDTSEQSLLTPAGCWYCWIRG